MTKTLIYNLFTLEILLLVWLSGNILYAIEANVEIEEYPYSIRKTSSISSKIKYTTHIEEASRKSFANSPKVRSADGNQDKKTVSNRSSVEAQSSSTQNLITSTGWNLISIPSDLQNPTVENVFPGKFSGTIWRWDAQGMRFITVPDGLLSDNIGYWVYATGPIDISSVNTRLGFEIISSETKSSYSFGFFPNRRTITASSGFTILLVHAIFRNDSNVRVEFSSSSFLVLDVNDNEVDEGFLGFENTISQFGTIITTTDTLARGVLGSNVVYIEWKMESNSSIDIDPLVFIIPDSTQNPRFELEMDQFGWY